MTVLQACGYSLKQLLQHSFIMAAIVSAFVMVVMLWLSPVIAGERAKLLRTKGIQTLIQTIAPKRFQAGSNGRQVFYVEEMNAEHTVAKNVFLAKSQNKDEGQQWDILWADEAFADIDAKNSGDYLTFKNGKVYQGKPGQADYQIAEFARYQARLPPPAISDKHDIRTTKTAYLWPLLNNNLEKAAELQWRFSVPIMVLILTLVAVPLSRVNPRAGKYARLLPAIVLYIIYANFMFVARDWIVEAKIPVWAGMWWLHATVAILGILLLWRQRISFS